VRDYLVAQGFEKKVIHLQPTPKMDPRTVLLTVQYAKGIPPQPCPDWSKNATHNYNDGNASNFGCAYNNNLILQLADPEDYNKGEGAPHFDGARDSAVLGHYLADTAQPAGGGGGGSTTTTSSSPSP
jgi:pilus assembly protein CpaD